MFQPDLFATSVSAGQRQVPNDVDAASSAAPSGRVSDPDARLPKVAALDLPAVLERIADISARPRYTFMVLNLIARAAGKTNSAGPYVYEDGRAIPIRDWLSDALLPMAQRDVRRIAIVTQIRAELEDQGRLPDDPQLAKDAIANEVRNRLRHSGRTNVSRAVSDLVRAGMIRRHYQGYRVDHPNRGAQREAVYTIAQEVRGAIGKVG
jgi:hypothetical protein